MVFQNPIHLAFVWYLDNVRGSQLGDMTKLGLSDMRKRSKRVVTWDMHSDMGHWYFL